MRILTTILLAVLLSCAVRTRRPDHKYVPPIPERSHLCSVFIVTEKSMIGQMMGKRLLEPEKGFVIEDVPTTSISTLKEIGNEQ